MFINERQLSVSVVVATSFAERSKGTLNCRPLLFVIFFVRLRQSSYFDHVCVLDDGLDSGLE